MTSPTCAIGRGQHGERMLQQSVAAGAVLVTKPVQAGGRNGRGRQVPSAKQARLWGLQHCSRGSNGWVAAEQRCIARRATHGFATFCPQQLMQRSTSQHDTAARSKGSLAHRKRLSLNSGSPPTQAWLPPLRRSSRRTVLLSLSATGWEEG